MRKSVKARSSGTFFCNGQEASISRTEWKEGSSRRKGQRVEGREAEEFIEGLLGCFKDFGFNSELR